MNIDVVLDELWEQIKTDKLYNDKLVDDRLINNAVANDYIVLNPDSVTWSEFYNRLVFLYKVGSSSVR